MFIISLTYTKPIEEVEQHLAKHIEYLKEQYSAGNFLASGRKIPRTGGIILSRVETKNEIDEIIKQDPFHMNQVANYDIIEFSPTMTCVELDFLKENPK